MNDVQAEIQAVLQEMQGDGHGEDLAEVEDLSSVQYSQRNHNSRRAPEPYIQNFAGINSHLCSQQPMNSTQAAPTLNSLPYARESGPLDTYGWFSVYHLLFENSHLLRSSPTCRTLGSTRAGLP